MSDERDETRRFVPSDADATQADGSRAGEGIRGETGGADDATQVHGPSGGDPTAVTPPRSPGSTSVLPPATDDWAASRANAAWSGRAEVRAPRSTQPSYQEADWPAGPGREPRDRWWMPIVLGIVGLVLLAALSGGIYLIVRNSGSDQGPGPATTTSAAAPPTAAATTPSTAPSSGPATTTPTTETTTETTTNPTDESVVIPALQGLSLAQAQAALHSEGMTSRVIYRASDAEPGTVIDSDPKEGQEVPPDTVVTLVVSAPATSTPPATATTTAGG